MEDKDRENKNISDFTSGVKCLVQLSETNWNDYQVVKETLNADWRVISIERLFSVKQKPAIVTNSSWSDLWEICIIAKLETLTRRSLCTLSVCSHCNHDFPSFSCDSSACRDTKKAQSYLKWHDFGKQCILYIELWGMWCER